MTGKRTGITKIGEIGLAALNEYADQAFAGCALLSRRPSTPTFWFYQLALDANVRSWGPALRGGLSERAAQLLSLVNLKGYTKWCTCLDDDLRHGAGIGRGAGGGVRILDGYEPRVACWACLLDAHDRCTHDCSAAGEIHFLETILDPRAA